MPPLDPEDDLSEDIDETQDEVEDEGGESGSIDDEGRDEAEARQESQDAASEERPVSRASKAVIEAKRIAREATEKAARFERELQEERSRRAEREKPQGETPEQENARLALLTIEERFDYKLAKAKTENERQMNLVRFQSADAADRAAYQAKGSFDPRFKKYEAEVEQLLQATRAAGRDVGFSREEVLSIVLGRKILVNKAKVDTQRANGQRNIARQRTRPDGSGSDRASQRTRPGSGNDLSALEKRLEGVAI